MRVNEEEKFVVHGLATILENIKTMVLVDYYHWIHCLESICYNVVLNHVLDVEVDQMVTVMLEKFVPSKFPNQFTSEEITEGTNGSKL